MSAYTDTVLNGELDAIRTDTAGRNDSLFKHAARLYSFCEAGVWSYEDMTDRLMSEARAIGLTAQEIKDTLKSARREVAGCPAEIPSEADAGMWLASDMRDPQPPEDVQEPPQPWQEHAGKFLAWSQEKLWAEVDEAGLDYLHQRGLGALVAFNNSLGYNPQRLERSRARWGLALDPDRGDVLTLTAGIVIPYIADGRLLKLEVRSLTQGKWTVAGSANALWGCERLHKHRPAILVEGVFNALTILQEAGDLVTPVAIGAASHARRVRWIAQLAFLPLVLIATDQGPAGEDAASYWLSVLAHNGRRWRPYTDDPNSMHRAGLNVRQWIQAGLETR